MVKISLKCEDSSIRLTEVMTRWFAEWLLANIIRSGFYEGKRIMSAKIIAFES